MKLDRADFQRLVELHHRRLYNVALRLTSDPDAAAELTQDTFLRAFRGWDKFRKESQSYTWMYRIMVNLNKDRLAKLMRVRSREQPLGLDDSEDPAGLLPDPKQDVQRQMEVSELQKLVQSAIQGLPEGYRECIVLRDVEGLSYQEIADTIGVSLEAVRSRLARARHHLREALSPLVNDSSRQGG
jgi:RNA polymerase sigma-70 factor (ECF subfamily)